MNLRYLASLLPLLVLAGCASAPAAEEKTAGAQAQKSCERVYQVGSLMPKKDCSGPVSDAERERLQQELSNKIRPSANAIGTGG